MRLNKELGDIWAPWPKTLYLATTTRSKVSLLHDDIFRGHCEEIDVTRWPPGSNIECEMKSLIFPAKHEYWKNICRQKLFYDVQ